ncbi:MAG: efflux RND transporter periplasmic adaptor subunit [Tepidisphaeraceae bacterium]|jgi:RND family efflux transporter MFP subunit
MIPGKSIQQSVIAGMVLCLLSLSAGGEATGGNDAAQGQTVQALSAPSAKHALSFTELGILKEMLVKPGDHVTVGQVLATEDSDLEQQEYNAMKIEAESTSKIDAAVVDRDSKKRERDNKQKAYENGGANVEEVEQAKLAYEEAEIQIRYAKEEHSQKQAALLKQQTKVEKMKLLSPVSGIVEKISLQPGEVVDPARPEGALTVVRNKPLWVDLHLTPTQAAKLKLGDKLQAAYVMEPDQWMTGTVIFFDPVVDSTVDKRTVRLELPNDEDKPAGLELNVRVPQP